MFNIFCLMVSGGPLNDAAAFFLMEQACELARSGKKKDFLMSEHFDGMISTEYRYASLGSHANGTIFLAVIESERGKTTVNFLADISHIQKMLAEELPWHRIGHDGSVSEGRGRSCGS